MPFRVEPTYLQLLRDAVEAAGGQGVVAEIADINQATISRALRDDRPTYTTLVKLAVALGAPEPMVPVRDVAHARWCLLGATLSEHRPEEFRSLLNLAELADGAGRSTPTDEEVDRLKSVVANPHPSRLARRKNAR